MLFDSNLGLIKGGHNDLLLDRNLVTLVGLLNVALLGCLFNIPSTVGGTILLKEPIDVFLLDSQVLSRAVLADLRFHQREHVLN